MSVVSSAGPGLRLDELELVVSTIDGSTVFANGAVLAHAQACDLAGVRLAELCAFDSAEQLDDLLAQVMSGIDEAITVPVRQAFGPPVPMTLTMHGLRASADDPVTTVVLRFTGIEPDPSSDPSSDTPSGPRDPLTGLLDRTGLMEALATALLVEAETAVLFVDMDHFKRVNDTRGHHAGDQLLSQFAERLRRAVAGGVLARFGGDEFVIVLPSTTAERVEVCVREILDVTSRPFRLGSADVAMSASVGVAIARPTEAERDVERLLREADIALFEAKRLGRGRAQTFTPQLRQHFVERVELEDALRVALDRRELFVEYQPQVDLRTGRVVSNEALVRWHRDGVNIPPDRFIPIAEEMGMIGELGRQVLDAACRQHAQWRKDLVHPPAMIGVNVSPRQLNDSAFASHVEATLERYEIPPSALCLELTESDFEGLSEEVDVLHHLRELGCYIGMDDFGTGYSSLARLRDLPVEILKIDRRFVAGLGIDSDDTAIVAAIMSMSLTLGLHVIAEGVERPEQAAALTRLGCSVAQGYLFCRPELPSAITSRMMAKRIWKPVGGSGAVADRNSSLVARPRHAHRMFIHEFLDHVGVQMERDGDRGWGRGQQPRITREPSPR